MIIIEYLAAALILGFVTFFTYVGVHMACEKDKGDYIPLPWEEGGFFRKKKRPVYDKHKMAKTRDGDNT